MNYSIKAYSDFVMRLSAPQKTVTKKENLSCLEVKSNWEVPQTIKIDDERQNETLLQRLKNKSMPIKLVLGVTGSILGLGAIANLAYGASRTCIAKDSLAGTDEKEMSTPNNLIAHISQPENCVGAVSVYHGDHIAHTFACKDFISEEPCQLVIGNMQEGKIIKVDFGDTQVSHNFSHKQPYIQFSKNETIAMSDNSKIQNSACYASIPQICDEYRTEIDINHCDDNWISQIYSYGVDSKGESFTLVEWDGNVDSNKCYNIQRDSVAFSKTNGKKSDTVEIKYSDNSDESYTELTHNMNGQVKITTYCENGKTVVKLSNTGRCQTSDDYSKCKIAS